MCGSSSSGFGFSTLFVNSCFWLRPPYYSLITSSASCYVSVKSAKKNAHIEKDQRTRSCLVKCTQNPAASNPQTNTWQKIADELSSFSDTRTRILRLVEYGETLLPALEIGDRHQENRVAGCTAIVHVETDIESTPLGFRVSRVRGFCDAKITRGILAVLAHCLVGTAVEDLKNISVSQFASNAKLDIALSSARTTGISSILDLIKRQALSHTERDNDACAEVLDKNKIPTSVDLLAGRYTGVQREEVAVLLSGGVDSSVAMRLLMEQGMKVVPFYLKIWLQDELAHLNECPWEEDVGAASAVCEQAGVKLETINLQKEYWDQVVSYTVREAKMNRTPNPDVMCNSRIKFGVFYDSVGKHFSNIASGHYARTEVDFQTNEVTLLKSPDRVKDQTYFLANLRAEQLRKALFPLGFYQKTQVRALAEKFELPNRNRKDSQGICFLGKLRFSDFLEHYLGTQPGPLVDYDHGLVVGTHRGFWFYTLGQRKGICLSGGPWYVVCKNAELNTVYVSRNYDALEKSRSVFEVEDLNWIGSAPTMHQLHALQVKVRHSSETLNCFFQLISPGKAAVTLETSTLSLAPGQFAAFYRGDICLGSGVICSDFASDSAPKEVIGVTDKQLQAHNFL